MAEKEADNVKLAVLEEKVFNMVEVISKLDDTIEKLSDLSVNVSKMLAVHEEKLDFARDSAAQSAKEIVLLETKVDAHQKEVSGRLRSVERRVWMGMGIVLAVSVFIQTGTVTQLFPERPRTAIINPKV